MGWGGRAIVHWKGFKQKNAIFLRNANEVSSSHHQKKGKTNTGTHKFMTNYKVNKISKGNEKKILSAANESGLIELVSN